MIRSFQSSSQIGNKVVGAFPFVIIGSLETFFIVSGVNGYVIVEGAESVKLAV